MQKGYLDERCKIILNDEARENYKTGRRSEIKIFITAFESTFHGWQYYESVLKKGVRKKTWEYIVDTDSYKYRKMSPENQELFKAKEYSKHVTPEEILQAKMELWEKLKPV